MNKVYLIPSLFGLNLTESWCGYLIYKQINCNSAECIMIPVKFLLDNLILEKSDGKK